MRTYLHSVDPVPTDLLLWGTDRPLRAEAYRARAEITRELRILADDEDQSEYHASRVARGLLSGRGI